MGCITSLTGTLTAREDIPKSIQSFLFENGCDLWPDEFETDHYHKGDTVIFSMNWKIYNAGPHIATIARLFNGTLECNGEEHRDMWQIIFKDGEILTSTANISSYSTAKPQEVWTKAQLVEPSDALD